MAENRTSPKGAGRVRPSARKATDDDFILLMMIDGSYHEVGCHLDAKGRLIVGKDLGPARWVP